MNPARLVMPALRARDGQFEHLDGEITAALGLGVGGFIIFGGTAANVRELTAQLQRRTPYPLLFAADLERGAGQQFLDLTSFPPPRALASLNDATTIRAAATVTAREARSIGINWIFAPVADLDIEAQNPIVQTRAFGSDPAVVAAAVTQWITGCQSQGVAACVKHFPGHGRTTQDSHGTLPVVTASAEVLAADLLPFRAAVAAGVASVMTAHVAFPALDPSGLPATRSRTMLTLLREDLRFKGPVVTDALMMAGATSGVTEAEAACEVVLAGVDILLYPSDTQGVVAALQQRMADSALLASRVAEALATRDQLFEAGIVTDEPAVEPPILASAEEIAHRLLVAGSRELPHFLLRAPLELITIDDDLDSDWPASSNQVVATELGERGISLGLGGSRIVLTFCEARAGKRRGGFGPATLATLAQVGRVDLIILFGHERLVPALGGVAPVLVGWHRQPLMQRAVAAFLQGRLA